MALEAIFGSDEINGTTRDFCVRLTSDATLRLHFVLPVGYPSKEACVVRCEYCDGVLHNATDDKTAAALGTLTVMRAAELVGRPAVFDVVSAAKEWLASPPSEIKDEESESGDEEEEEEDDGETTAALAALQCVPKALRWWETDDSEERSDALIREAHAAATARVQTADAIEVFDSQRRSKKRSGHGTACAEWAPFTIGLIGKPSSGKSTLFNAAIGVLSGVDMADGTLLQQSKAAKMAAHPFTTIAPNTGKAFATVPCPCASLGLRDRCAAQFGHTASGERLVPIIIKDVAGLVPGAYNGRGRGNRFLDDLTVADALVHVVDVSGETDAEGRADTAHDPAEDVGWVATELHRWIFDNVRAKWPTIRRRPDKLLSMFSGYHAERSLVRQALCNAGVDPTTFALVQQDAPPLPLASWGPKELHRVVAHFLRTRFPICLALNKADAVAAVESKLVQHVAEVWPLEQMVPVSARGELLLQHMRLRGVARYELGSNRFEISDKLTPAMLIETSFAAGFRAVDDEAKPVPSSDEVSEALRLMQNNVLQPHGSSGVLAVLSRAMAMRHPAVAFPVADLTSFAAMAAFDGPPKPPGLLRDCVLLRPGSTVGDLCDAIKHDPWLLAGGDFVHAEAHCAASLSGKKTVCKDDRVTPDIAILSIATTRRAAP